MFSTVKNNYEFYKKQYFRGDDIYCPFCSGFYKAEKYKLTRELSSLCPVCGSTIEERTILLFLQAKTEFLSGELKVLTVTEPGRISEYFGNFPGAEVKIYNETGDFTIRDNTLKNKYESGSFDLIVCNYILEKLPDYISVLKELKRILKPDGLMMLQANIDPAKDKTAEYPITSYKDRMSMYGIAGNHRRFGSDYAELIRSQGIKVSRLKFTEGFDLLPGLTFDMNEVICLAHISDTPYLSDNMDEVEKELKEQKSNAGGSRISAFIYTALFIIPDVLRRSLMSLFGRLSEREENKGTILYMLYIILFGEFFYWTGLFLHIFFSSISQEFWFVGLFFLFTFGLGGAVTLVGYVFLNDRAGFIKKSIMALITAATIWFPLVSGLFAM